MELGSTQIGGLPRRGCRRHRPEDRLLHVFRYAVFKGWKGWASLPNTTLRTTVCTPPLNRYWLGMPLESDSFGRAMLATGVPLTTIKAECDDPVVPYQRRLSFCLTWVEDLDSQDCLRKSVSINARFSLQRRGASFRPDGRVCQRCPKLELCA